MFAIPVMRHRFRVGRAPDCDLQLPDSDQRLSREHFILEQRTTGLIIKDCSTNGTSCNGVPLNGCSRTLSGGDRISVGFWEIVLNPDLTNGKKFTEARWSDSTRRLQLPAASTENCGESVKEARYGMLGQSPSMLDVFRLVQRLSRFDVPVLIHGESGTGKELVAQALHSSSERGSKPLVALNCAAILSSTAVSTLFGHEKGAFTGAAQRHAGVFEQSAGGTLFLDEIAELSPELQASLLRVLETRTVRPLGATRELPVYFRLVTASHRDLRTEVEAGRFREDLFYRIGVTRVSLPPLRQRGPDIMLLARHFLKQHAPGPIPQLSQLATSILQKHPWPGNIRELRNAMLRALVLCDGPMVLDSHLDLDDRVFTTLDSSATRGLRAIDGGSFRVPPARLSAEEQRERLLNALHRSGGNRSQAASLLGISRSTLYSRIKSLEIAASKETVSQ
jgi:DNA-binding NtrC family response regulator